MPKSNTKYVIITPVRNEEEFIESTLNSIVKQTILPAEFILVNDGSTDRTTEIIEEFQKKFNWIKCLEIKDRGYYLPGSGVVHAFYKGYNKLSVKDWNYVVKLDGDLSFENNYFESLINEFQKNPKLGIASGGIYQKNRYKLIKEKAQEDHPWGASKVYRKECLNSIGGIKAIPGWDLADILAAQMNGWQTRCFAELKIIHHRPTGGRRKGLTGGFFLHGRNLYRFGYSFFYTFFKGIYRLADKPLFFGGAGIISGYIYAFLKREDFLFDKKMRTFLRKKHLRILSHRMQLKRFFKQY